jgi:hypothetical protein
MLVTASLDSCGLYNVLSGQPPVVARGGEQALVPTLTPRPDIVAGRTSHPA